MSEITEVVFFRVSADPSTVARFMAKFCPTDSGCWDWQATKGKTGYGKFFMGGRKVLAHRAAYQMFVADIPAGLCVLHICHRRCCCNPAHLMIGTQVENMRQMAQSGRAAAMRGEANGNSRLTEAQVHAIRQLWGSGGVSQATLARVHDIGATTVRKIVHRASWRHID